ncbi:hypothetical protein BKA80DRAFT_279812 [Phyllosticta citrichinensis]
MPRRRTTANSISITALSTDTCTQHSASGSRLDLSHPTSKRPPPSCRLASPLRAIPRSLVTATWTSHRADAAVSR